jgi:hypothetical protein
VSELTPNILLMYSNEPCRICGRLLTVDDIETAVFTGYSEDNKERSAHERCWQGFVNVLRSAPADKLAELLAPTPPAVRSQSSIDDEEGERP